MKVVFVLAAIHQQRCMKRIDEFVDNGYDVEAYGFEWNGEIVRKNPKVITVNKIGTIDGTLPYYKRSATIFKGIKNVLRQYKSDNVLYYLFGLDMAIFYIIQTRAPFIYEESDLMHTYMGNSIFKILFETIDKMVIKRSLLSVFTSEGFIKYHFGDRFVENTIVIPNRLAVSVKELSPIKKQTFDPNHISFGFVGFIRFKSIYNFARLIGEYFPNHSFHFYGVPHNGKQEELFYSLKKYGNCIFHGSFSSPDELPSIYSNIDVVLSTYDIEHDNVKYAEPNKIYESIYFKTPIIVSSNTFLSEKVKSLNIGFDINPLNDNEVIDFVSHLSESSVKEKIKSISSIDSDYPININDSFFEMLKNKITNL